MGAKSQRKGRAGEIELAGILRDARYDSVRTGIPVSYGCEPDLVGLPGIHCEVKRVERLNLEKAMEQSERDSERFRDGMPTVFHRKNRGEWAVSMRLTDWLMLYGQWRD